VSNVVVSVSWRQNVICKNLIHHLPTTVSASATGCVVHALDFLPTTNPAREDDDYDDDDNK